jgi:hypothetical protein
MLLRLVAFSVSVTMLGAVAGAAPFAHRFSPGETLRYKYSVAVTADTARRSFGGEAQLTVTSVEPTVAGTEVRTQISPARRETRSFSITKDGSLTFAGERHPSHNYVIYDPHQYCAMPSSTAVGASWACKTDSRGIFHGGDARVRVLSADDSGITLEIDGSGSDLPRIDHDADTGKDHTSRSSTSWHEVVRFKDGIVATIVRDQLTRTVVENLTVDTRIVERIERL